MEALLILCCEFLRRTKRRRIFWRAKSIKNIKANAMIKTRCVCVCVWERGGERESLQNRNEEKFRGQRKSNNASRRICDWYRSFAAGECSKAFVKSYLKVKGHCIRLVAYDGCRGGREKETVGGEGRRVRNARRVPVKAELPDDQRALKEDWDASAATRLTTRPCVRARVCVARRN